MKVSDAVNSRKSIRAFLDKPVDTDLITNLLQLASRAPSGGNLQPWHIYVLNGKIMLDFKGFMNKWENPELPQ